VFHLNFSEESEPLLTMDITMPEMTGIEALKGVLNGFFVRELEDT